MTIVYTAEKIKGHNGSNAILCENGKITAIGRRGDFSNHKTVELRGSIYPGFIDSHLHLLGLGWSMEALDLRGMKSPEEIAAKVQKATESAAHGQWIEGRGWDQNLWKGIHFPTREKLDKVAPYNPVYLRRIDGHAGWTNTLGLKFAGITEMTPDPEGGNILKDKKGNPTGILIDKAEELVLEVIPEPDAASKRRQIQKAIVYLNSLGITAVHDAGTNSKTIDILAELEMQEKLTLRVSVMLENNNATLSQYVKKGPVATEFIRIQAVKIYLDGAMGSRGAAMLVPYSDDHSNSGLLLDSKENVLTKVKEYNSAGFQVCIHAIGDRANRMALDIYERVGLKQRRNRIEHAQNIDPFDIPRFANFGVIPAMQPTHCTSDMGWIHKRLGTGRLENAYPWKALLNSGSIIAGGSDAPIESPNPLQGIYAAVTRQDQNGYPEKGWLAQHCVSIDEAVKMYTEWAATGAGMEDIQGKIAPGYYADFTVLSSEFDTNHPQSIINTEVLATIVNGKIVHKA